MFIIMINIIILACVCSLENRDPTFLAETGIRHKSAADRMLLGPVDSSAVRVRFPGNIWSWVTDNHKHLSLTV
jgi:hypothetical protein